MKTILAFLLLTLGTSSYAQYDDSYMFDNIDIDGTYSENSNESAADRMRKMRAKLEKRNEVMVQKRIENVRFQQEKEMMKKLNQSMNQTFQQIDQNLNNM